MTTTTPAPVTTPRPGRCSAKDLAEANFKPFDANDAQDFYDDGQTLLVTCADFSYPTMNRVRYFNFHLNSIQVQFTDNLRKKPGLNAFVSKNLKKFANLLLRNPISNVYLKVYVRYQTFKALNSTTSLMLKKVVTGRICDSDSEKFLITSFIQSGTINSGQILRGLGSLLVLSVLL